MRESSADRGLLALAGTGDCDAAGELYDRYGTRMYALATMVSRSPHDAESAVAHGFRAAAAAASECSESAVQVLAREILAACPRAEGRQALWTSLLALTLYGAHTYRDAAVTLGIEPEDAARYLRIALHGSSRTGSSAVESFRADGEAQEG